jgi:4-carboxymuconolactone decarboxylase
MQRPSISPDETSMNGFSTIPVPRRQALKKLIGELVVAANLLLAGGMSTVAHAQSQPPGAPETAGTKHSRAQELMGTTAPKLAELTDSVLYGDIWERPGLSKRDRSLVTIAALIALNRPDQLQSHIKLGLQNGLTKDEIVETITHMAFYSGWPSAVSAVAVAKDIFEKN